MSTRLLLLAETFPAVVLTGARQVGKSTLVEHLFGARAELIVFDPVQDVGNARKDPDLFLANHRTPLILDEVQYAPELVAAIKRRLDRDRTPGQYIMTGSQQWGVLGTMAESLTGRAVILDLEGLSLGELARAGEPEGWLAAWLRDFTEFTQSPPARLRLERTLFEQIWRGWLPEAQYIPQATVPDFLASYQRTYIERDVRLLAEVADWELFGRFFRLVCAHTAREINHRELGRDLDITHQTSKRWIDTLKATFQWYEVPAWSGNTVKRVSLKPKGFLADTGFAAFAQAIASPGVLGGHPLWGPLFETAVAGEIRKQCSLLSPRPHVYHWRAHSGAEVDVVLDWNGVLYPIEVKAASRPTRRDVTGIAAFRATYPRRKIAPGLVVAPTEAMLRLGQDDWSIPWDLGGMPPAS